MREISGYKIIKPLGQGGMSTVYLAVQKSVDRYVALKIMSPQLVHDETYAMRFLREARIAARFRHPNIISILDVNVSNGVPYIAMEYVPGGALDTKRIKSMNLTEKLGVIVQIADALAFLHGQNFIHRDIKPANILFRENNTAVLTDFGIASDQSVNSRMTLTGFIIGTPHYMSPEQAKGGKLDSRSDLYSLGVMMFRVLTGKLPFTADNHISICNMHINAPVPDLPEEHARFDPIIKKVMAKSPDERYKTANEFIDDLISVTGSETARMLRRSLGGVALQAIRGEDVEKIDSVVERFSPSSMQTNLQPSLSTMSLIRRKTKLLTKINYRAKISPLSQRLKKIILKFLGFLPKSVQSSIRNICNEQPKLALGSLTGFLVLSVVLVMSLPDGGPGEIQPPINDESAEIETSLIASRLDHGRQALDETRLVRPEKDSAVYYFQSVLDLEPDNKQAQEGLESVDRQLLKLASTAMDYGSLLTAGIWLDDARELPVGDRDLLARLDQRHLELSAVDIGNGDENKGPAESEMEQSLAIPEDKLVTAVNHDEASLTRLEQKNHQISDSPPPQNDEISRRLSLGQEYLSQYKLTRPAKENAVSEFNKVLTLEPDNAIAIAGLNQVGEKYLQLARDQIGGGNWKKAEDYWQLSSEYAPNLSGAVDVRQQLDDHASGQFEVQSPRRTDPDRLTSNIPPGSIAGYKLPQMSLASNESANSLYRLAESAWKSNQKMQAYSLYKEVLRINPDHNKAKGRLNSGAGSYLTRAGRDIGRGDLFAAHNNLAIALALDPAHGKLDYTQRDYLTARDKLIIAFAGGNSQGDLVSSLQITSLLEEAELNHRRFKQNNANRGAAKNAQDKYSKVLNLQTTNQAARNGLSGLLNELIAASGLAFDQARNGDALWYLNLASEIDPNNPGLPSLEARLN